ncbi:multidrug ABC transporter ATP-binding protein [Oleiphilus sp. HI0071]|uniref:ABC transporter ATP-binding protein n=4 Tax=unclassified Oleiphilus TaxID=2631174 RepID=UPI0007C28CDF|nr:ABC transporter ATP-binding protein [Oleiphilus sp. HI0079]KZY59195.1 multidrug ABC transporter ATP-binding protein [Oleiphilus sp. HI0065]KZY80071.1 multidrug ABC transporter ATP-binding protein [Oleiphilus sp. HI0071]KZY96665.1 multidrug ABC transporter ATP-binding protein [Oleiphilus sp. HI0073]KZZ50825.1 multidrug ABC transporter ATP-binding protein [Oleiphilus sp. HI0122]KZZ74189.1 multidrug ABC transporter ATP-binding protein [Oleiphilus sp. HI0133]
MFRFFEKLVNPFPPEPPETAPSTLAAFCIHYTRGVIPHLLVMAGLTACIAVMEVSLFRFLGELVDLLTANTPETLWQNHSNTLISYALIVLVILPFAVLLHSSIIHQALLGNYPMRIRWNSHRYLLGQSLSFFQDEFAGRIATKVMQTALSVREAVMKLLDVLLYVSVYFIGMVSVLGLSDPTLCIPLILWFLGYLGALRAFIPQLREISTQQADARSAMTGSVVDTYTNISTVKLFSHAQREADYAKSAMDDFLQTVHPQMRLVTKLNVSVWFLNSLLLFSISTLSIYLWSNDAVSTGAIAVAIGLALRLNGMSQWIMWEVSNLFENIGSVQDGMNTIAQPKVIQDKKHSKPLDIRHGAIEFNHVDFEYTLGEQVLKDLSLNIKAGEKIGLVGRSGAGKSTLVNLLLRFHDLNRGSIRIDGQDVNQVKQESLRAQIGVVTQDTSLLHRSVFENITYGRPDATIEEVIEAAKKAEAHTFIQGLSDAKGRTGYEAHVGERGVKLSGGQRQRIAIARVLLKDAPILVLDEATSALDSEVEAAIQESLYNLMEGKTVIAIAHRLSTIAAMDRLIVIDEGRIIEQGSHRQLVEHQGIYAQLWQRQSGGFIGE